MQSNNCSTFALWQAAHCKIHDYCMIRPYILISNGISYDDNDYDDDRQEDEDVVDEVLENELREEPLYLGLILHTATSLIICEDLQTISNPDPRNLIPFLPDQFSNTSPFPGWTFKALPETQGLEMEIQAGR